MEAKVILLDFKSYIFVISTLPFSNGMGINAQMGVKA